MAPALNVLFLLGFLAWCTCPSSWRGNRAALALALAALGPLALAFGLVPTALILRTPLLGNIWHLGNTFSCPLLILFALLAVAACGDNQKAPVQDDAGVQVDATPQALAPCLDRPDTFDRPPTGQLPCDLLPPGFTAP